MLQPASHTRCCKQPIVACQSSRPRPRRLQHGRAAAAASVVGARWALHAQTGATGALSGAASAVGPQQQQHLQYSASPPPAPAGAVTVTWTGLLAALGLAAAALVSAAVTCFFLWIKPVMQAMSVTLAEMEAASREMQQAAQEVEELVGGINSAIKLLMQPTSLLKWNSATTPGSNTANSSPLSSDDAGSSAADAASSSPAGTAAAATASTTMTSSGSEAAVTSTASDFGSNTARQLTSQLEVLAPGFVDGLRGLSKLQLADLGLAALKLSGLDETTGRHQGPQQQRRGGRMVWDMLSSSLTTRSTRRSLARLRSDLAAAANVLGVLLAPPSSRLYEQLQQDVQLGQQPRAGMQQQKLQGQQQRQQVQPHQQQQVQEQEQGCVQAAATDSIQAVSSSHMQDPGSGSGDRSSSISMSGSAGSSRGSRAAVQYDEWGLPITAAELSSASEAASSAASQAWQQSTSRAAGDAGEAAASRLHQAWLQQQQQQQQQQRWRPLRGNASLPSSDDEAWHLDLGQYGSYLEQEPQALATRADSGITLQQLQQDPALMHRVFCDNQELTFAQQWDKPQQQQQQQEQQQAAGQQQQGKQQAAG